MSTLEAIIEAVIIGDAYIAKELSEKAVAEGIDAESIINEGLLAGMIIVGDKFKNDEFCVPDVLVSAKAMTAGMNVVKPLLVSKGIKEKGTVIIGTVEGDLHDVGKSLVIMMLEGSGFKVIDLGFDVSAEEFAAAAKEHQPQLVALSALTTTTMLEMKRIIKHLKPLGVKVLIGGAPITPEFAGKIGADGFAADAIGAMDVANDLLAAY